MPQDNDKPPFSIAWIFMYILGAIAFYGLILWGIIRLCGRHT